MACQNAGGQVVREVFRVLQRTLLETDLPITSPQLRQSRLASTTANSAAGAAHAKPATPVTAAPLVPYELTPEAELPPSVTATTADAVDHAVGPASGNQARAEPADSRQLNSPDPCGSLAPAASAQLPTQGDMGLEPAAEPHQATASGANMHSHAGKSPAPASAAGSSSSKTPGSVSSKAPARRSYAQMFLARIAGKAASRQVLPTQACGSKAKTIPLAPQVRALVGCCCELLGHCQPSTCLPVCVQSLVALRPTLDWC